nr:hypothetical protein [Micromonospora sp. DSM 115978]
DYVAPLWDGAVIEPDIRVLVEEGDHDQLRLLAQALAASASAAASGGTSDDEADAGETNPNVADAEITAAILLMPLRHFFGLYIRDRPLDLDRVLDALTRAWLAVLAAKTTAPTDAPSNQPALASRIGQ